MTILYVEYTSSFMEKIILNYQVLSYPLLRFYFNSFNTFNTTLGANKYQDFVYLNRDREVGVQLLCRIPLQTKTKQFMTLFCSRNFEDCDIRFVYFSSVQISVLHIESQGKFCMLLESHLSV